MRILFVEDDATDRMAVQRVAGADDVVDVATSLAEARRLLNGHDAVLCDLHLPDSSAWETVEWLASIPHPCVVYTIADDERLAATLGKRGLPFLHKSNVSATSVRFVLRWARGASEKHAELTAALDELRDVVTASEMTAENDAEASR